MTSPLRQRFLETALLARDVIAAAPVAAAWDQPSVLRRWTVGGLAAHLGRAVLIVPGYLDAPLGDADLTPTAAGYYARISASTDPDDEMNSAIRRRADETAGAGHAALVADLDSAMPVVRQRLQHEAAGRRIAVFAGVVLPLDEYLRTRIVEMTVHLDDLCLSAGLELPENPALPDAIATMVEVARERHGDLAVMRALSRRERDVNEALRVF